MPSELPTPSVREIDPSPRVRPWTFAPGRRTSEGGPSGTTGHGAGGSRRRPLVAIALVSLTVVGALMVVGLAAGWVPVGTHRSPAISGPSVFLNLSISADPATGLDQFTPANFTLPANTRVVVTITNFDIGANPVSPMWGKVMGTVNGTESVSYGSSGTATVLGWLAPSQVSHTLTILPAGWTNSPTGMGGNGSMMNGWGSGGYGSGSMGSNGSMGIGGEMGGGMGGSGMGMWSPALPALGYGMMGTMVNLPIPAALDDATPAVVTTTVIFVTHGTFAWWCEAPCDPAAMATAGFMWGAVTVS